MATAQSRNGNTLCGKEPMSEMTVTESEKIPGLLKISLVVHEDDRGSFTELFQAEKLHDAGFPDWFTPVQTNLSTNNQKGVTRGIHAEPWNKYITPLSGKAFVAIVDLRPDNFGKLETFELKKGDALFVPKGCGNSYQTLEDNTFYLYHVDAHWQAGLAYPSIHPFDQKLAIQWPIGADEAIISDKDAQNPSLQTIKPIEVN